MNGYSVFRWASGKVYIGNRAADLKHGVGELPFKDGNDYSRKLISDKRQGYDYY